jgi:DMSO/TMAO reductase YedYZ molybdopterin-dependent catalytic subunit
MNVAVLIRVAAAACCIALTTLNAVSAQPTKAVAIAGNVADAKTLTVDDLKGLPAQDIEYAPRREGDTGTGPPPRRYTGALLRDVLNAAKPMESKPRELRRSYVVATASDGYEVVFSWGELFLSPQGERVYVVYARDGAPLGDDEGRIALVAVGDRGSARHVKWLKTLTLRAATLGPSNVSAR